MRDKASHNMPDVVQDINEDALCCQWFTVQHLQLEHFSAGWSPPPYGALQLPMGSFTCPGPCICSSLWGCGPKDIHEKENKDERREYTHFSWHIHRLLKAIWFPLKRNWTTLLEGHFGRWHKKGTLHLKQVGNSLLFL